ncbi:MAG: Gfo/Idh/MocA family oxidoreductase [Planctomycetota bacterium]
MSMKRRDFLKATAATGAAFSTSSLLSSAYAAPDPNPRRIGANEKLNVLSVGVVGSIGAHDLKMVSSHPNTHISGLCDIDANYLERAGNTYKDAFKMKDYREVFDKHSDKFDAVICATPDHTHCAIDTIALSKGKHVYGQKPLVQQLEEVYILKAATKANPTLSTQMGNQRMQSPGRRAAVHVMKSGMLGKVKEVFVTTGSGLQGGGGYFNNRKEHPVESPPAHLDWDLWQSGVQPALDYRKDIHPLKWRAMWDYGTGGLGDWGCHLLDVIFYSFPELDSPIAVQAEVTDPPKGLFHAFKSKTVMTYPTKSDKFSAKTVKVHYHDEGQVPSKAELGLPDSVNPTSDRNQTAFVCEGGTLILTAGGRLEIWRDGKNVDWKSIEGMPEFKNFNHWHEWVNTAIGNHNPDLHWSPFGVGLKITEGSLLPVKATKYPGKELKWDATKLEFTNHAEATKTIVKRDYREGFEPVRVGSA